MIDHPMFDLLRHIQAAFEERSQIDHCLSFIESHIVDRHRNRAVFDRIRTTQRKKGCLKGASLWRDVFSLSDVLSALIYLYDSQVIHNRLVTSDCRGEAVCFFKEMLVRLFALFRFQTLSQREKQQSLSALSTLCFAVLMKETSQMKEPDKCHFIQVIFLELGWSGSQRFFLTDQELISLFTRRHHPGRTCLLDHLNCFNTRGGSAIRDMILNPLSYLCIKGFHDTSKKDSVEETDTAADAMMVPSPRTALQHASQLIPRRARRLDKGWRADQRRLLEKERWLQIARSFAPEAIAAADLSEMERYFLLIERDVDNEYGLRDALAHTMRSMQKYLAGRLDVMPDEAFMRQYLHHLSQVTHPEKGKKLVEEINLKLLPAIMRNQSSQVIYEALQMAATLYQKWPLPSDDQVHYGELWLVICNRDDLSQRLEPGVNLTVRGEIIFYMLGRGLMTKALSRRLSTDRPKLQEEVYRFVEQLSYPAMDQVSQFFIKSLFITYILRDRRSLLNDFFAVGEGYFLRKLRDDHSNLLSLMQAAVRHDISVVDTEGKNEFDCFKQLMKAQGSVISDDAFCTDQALWCDVHLLGAILYHAIEIGLIDEESYRLFSSDRLRRAMYAYMQQIGKETLDWGKKEASSLEEDCRGEPIDLVARAEREANDLRIVKVLGQLTKTLRKHPERVLERPVERSSRSSSGGFFSFFRRKADSSTVHPPSSLFPKK